MATLTTVLRVQKASFYVDALFSLRVAVIPILAHYHYSSITAISAFCGLSIVYHLIIVAVGLRAAMRYDRTLAPSPSPAKPLHIVPAGESYG
jgi:hypothetical protein